MPKVRVPCSWCRTEIQRYLSQINKNSYCSKDCRSKHLSKKHNPQGYKKHPHLAELNKQLNPERMTIKTRKKLRDARLGTGKGVSYEKTLGEHTHRTVAEKMLGRKLLPGEVVHHIDGNKRNNQPANLRVFESQKEHAAWHIREEKFFKGTVLGQEVMPK